MIALDVLRALSREPDGLERVRRAECALARGGERAAGRAPRRAADRRSTRGRARRAVEELALAFQASLLVRHAPAFVSDAFCAARLGGGGRVYGTLPTGVDGAAIVARALEID